MTLYRLERAPEDYVLGLVFTQSAHLLVAAWDGTCALYGPGAVHREPVAVLQHPGAITAVCATAHGGACAGGVDGTVRVVDLENGGFGEALGTAAALGVAGVAAAGSAIVAGSWDKTLRYLDPRTAATPTVVGLPGKCLALDANDSTVVVAMTNRAVHVYDPRQPAEPVQVRESGLKYQTTAVRLLPDGRGYAQLLIEGRIAMEWLDPLPQLQQRQYAFKCHRAGIQQPEVCDQVTLVNALAFHPTHHSLYTAGSDGHVCAWDVLARKRLKQYPWPGSQRQPVVALALHTDSTGVAHMAVACSDDRIKATAQGTPPRAPVPLLVHLRTMAPGEGRPKHRPSLQGNAR